VCGLPAAVRSQPEASPLRGDDATAQRLAFRRPDPVSTASQSSSHLQPSSHHSGPCGPVAGRNTATISRRSDVGGGIARRYHAPVIPPDQWTAGMRDLMRAFDVRRATAEQRWERRGVRESHGPLGLLMWRACKRCNAARRKNGEQRAAQDRHSSASFRACEPTTGTNCTMASKKSILF
jgi:hypothetical protein